MMKMLLILWLLTFAAPSDAAEVRRAIHASGKTLTLYPVECARSKPEAKRGKVEMHDPQGLVLFVGCWALSEEDGLVKIDWDDGDESTVPIRAFMVYQVKGAML